MDVWAVFAILFLMMTAGLAPLHHIVFVKHTPRDLLCLVPMATLNIIGFITLLNNAASLVFSQAIDHPDLDYLGSYACVNILLMALLWRSVRTVNLTPVQNIRIYTFFIAMSLGTMPLRSLMPRGQRLTIMLSAHYPELFQTAPVKHYVLQMCIEYTMLYFPLFCVLYRLYRQRLHQDITVRLEKGCVATHSPEEDCQQCIAVSPFLDIVSACLAVMILVVRPLYMFYTWWTQGVISDIENNFFILPYYTAICLLNITCSRKAANDNKLKMKTAILKAPVSQDTHNQLLSIKVPL